MTRFHKYMSIVTLTALTFLLSCTPKNNSTQAQSATAATATTAPIKDTLPPQQPTLPSLPQELVKKIYDTCTGIDYIFYDLPISMSQDDRPSIQGAAMHIAQAAAVIDPKQKSAAHLVYQSNGEVFLEGELYFHPKGYYFTFTTDKKTRKPMYANYLSEQGNNFYKKMLAQVGVQPKQ